MEILCGEEWEHSENISTVPCEHWKWFLGARVGNYRLKNMAGSARILLNNLRIVRDNEGWAHLGLKGWVETLADFGLTETTWAWLEASEPILLGREATEGRPSA
jgi:hypothetical protein